MRKKNARAAALLRDLEWRYAHLLPFESDIFGVNRVVLVRCRLSPPAELRALFNRATVDTPQFDFADSQFDKRRIAKTESFRRWR